MGKLISLHLLAFLSVWWSWELQRALVVASSAAQNAVVSPVSGWEPSWTASSVQSTTVAVGCTMQIRKGGGGEQQPAVLVVLSNSGASAASNSLQTSDNDDWIEVDNGKLRVLPHHPDRQRIIATASSSSAPRWALLGPSTVCCMTGLVADVDYLTRVLQKQVDVHRILYEGSRIMPTHELVRQVASHLREAAQFQGGRPYGIQALMIGLADTTASSSRDNLSLFTLDPGGGYRNWGMATAIGKDASLIRKRLYNLLSASSKEIADQSNVKVTLKVAIRALMEKEASSLPADAGATTAGGSSSDENSFVPPEALLIWKERSLGCLVVATIDPTIVQACASGEELPGERSKSL